MVNHIIISVDDITIPISAEAFLFIVLSVAIFIGTEVLLSMPVGKLKSFPKIASLLSNDTDQVTTEVDSCSLQQTVCEFLTESLCSLPPKRFCTFLALSNCPYLAEAIQEHDILYSRLSFRISVCCFQVLIRNSHLS